MSEQKKVANVLSEGDRLGVVGGGNMAKALLFPLFDKGILKPESVMVSAKTDGTLAPWRSYGCSTTHDNVKVTSSCDVVIWGTKPQIFFGAVPTGWNMNEERYTKSGSLHLSIMAGITLENFTKKLQDTLDIPPKTQYNLRCARTMPNIGSKVSSGVAVFCLGSSCADEDRQFIHRFYDPLGLCYEVAEPNMNAYTSLFGCGIGFMFPILEAMSDGAVKMGVPRAISFQIAAQTMKGAAELLLSENQHPGVLKDTVCSPGGTTICGIAEMERHGVRNGIISAIEAATVRSLELAKLK